MVISAAQIRAARGLLNWTQAQLAARSGLSEISIQIIEKGVADPRASSLAAIEQAFERAGVEFTDGKQPGVRMRSDLEAFIDESIRLSRQHGYYPTTFQAMRDRHTTVGAIEKLVVSGDLQTGFRKLRDLGLLDWSIEAAVMKFPHHFTRAARECAEFRLREARAETQTAGKVGSKRRSRAS
jgi:transcriptional regulator with XRE-family HTH domain